MFENNTRLEELEAENRSLTSFGRRVKNRRSTLLRRRESSLHLEALVPHGGCSSSQSEAHTQHHHPFQVRDLEIELKFPKFDGSNVLGWIFRAEHLFDYYATPDADRLTIAAIHMEKNVINWHRLMMRLSPFHSWKDLTRAPESEYDPSPYDSFCFVVPDM